MARVLTVVRENKIPNLGPSRSLQNLARTRSWKLAGQGSGCLQGLDLGGLLVRVLAVVRDNMTPSLVLIRSLQKLASTGSWRLAGQGDIGCKGAHEVKPWPH